MIVSDKVIGQGSSVSMHFCVTLEDGTIADSSRPEGATGDSEPLEFVIGDGSLIEGLEQAITGLKAGDKKTMAIGPEAGFGYHDEANVHTMSRSEYADDLQIKPGVIIGFDTPTGDEIPGTVIAVDEQEVIVDFNHPLAGHEITFDVEILAVDAPAAANEKQAGNDT